MSHDIVDKFRAVRTNVPRLIVDGRVEGDWRSIAEVSAKVSFRDH